MAKWLSHLDLAAAQLVDSSWARDHTHVSCLGWQILNHWTTREVLIISFIIWGDNFHIVMYNPNLPWNYCPCPNLEAGILNLQCLKCLNWNSSFVPLPTPVCLLSLLLKWTSPLSIWLLIIIETFVILFYGKILFIYGYNELSSRREEWKRMELSHLTVWSAFVNGDLSWRLDCGIESFLSTLPSGFLAPSSSLRHLSMNCSALAILPKIHLLNSSKAL